MSSLAIAVQSALAIKKVPPFISGSTHDLAKQLGMPFPVSIQDLIRTLDGLPYDSRTFDSGALEANYVHASAYLFVQSDGGVAWGGNVQEAGVFGDNFRVAVGLLDVKDAAGNALAFVHEDTIIGKVDIGYSDKNWTDYGKNQLIADNWEQVKTSRVQFELHVSTDPWQVAETVIAGVVVVIGAIVGGKVACPKGEWNCGWSAPDNPNTPLNPGDPRNPPGIGVDFKCRCESN
jgi:hypothetical protein